MIVIGNGQSRKKINLSNYHEEKIGCNAIIRDLHVDYLVCCDKKMVKQALAQKYAPIYTRDRWISDFNLPEVIALPDLPYKGDDRKDDPFHWGSGPYAVLLATKLSKYVKLVGFDLYGLNGKLNNVYANTKGYLEDKEDAVDYSYWVYQIAKIFEHNQHVTFHIYNLEDWKCPKQWKFNNLKVDNIENL
tara:strand:- start:227 stop:793 length:567 start_codon:yes stop_codon:yes gene_type:complete